MTKMTVKMAKLENYWGSVLEGQSEQKRLVKLIIIDPFFFILESMKNSKCTQTELLPYF